MKSAGCHAFVLESMLWSTKAWHPATMQRVIRMRPVQSSSAVAYQPGDAVEVGAVAGCHAFALESMLGYQNMAPGASEALK